MQENKNIINKNIDIVTSSLDSTVAVQVVDNMNVENSSYLVQEHPLTIYLNKKEIVTVMTMGSNPHYLVAGFLLNQRLVSSSHKFISIHIDWSVNSSSVYAEINSESKINIEKKIVTTGCGQGTMFASLLDDLSSNIQEKLSVVTIKRSQIYNLLGELSKKNDVYRKAGGVHSCALCTSDIVIKTIEDVGRHNAVDSLTGFLALNDITRAPSIMYTTGRLTSEMVIKTAQMGLSILISRSGATSMGVDIAKKTGITLISRAKGKSFQILNRADRVVFD